MNSRHTNIKFTCEEKNENKISVLYVRITREEDALTTTLSRKKTFSVAYLNFDSHLTVDYQKGLTETFLFRAYNVSSDYTILH